MEKSNSKIVAVAALVVAVIALSVGFAALSATLNISNDANITVHPANTFEANINYFGNATCTPSSEHVTVENAGTASGKNWSGIVVKLQEPGDYVTCEATVKNQSTFDGYLKSITADNNIGCTAASTDGASSEKVTAVCGDIEMTVGVGTNGTENVTPKITNSAHVGLSGITTNNSIAKESGTHKVKVTVTYKTPGTLADGDIQVTLPGIELSYNTEN